MHSVIRNGPPPARSSQMPRQGIVFAAALALSTLAGCSGSNVGSVDANSLYCRASAGPDTVCYAYANLSGETKSFATEQCEGALGGTIAPSCPSGRIGCCQTTTGGVSRLECFYTGSVQSHEAACQSASGQWSDGSSTSTTGMNARAGIDASTGMDASARPDGITASPGDGASPDSSEPTMKPPPPDAEPTPPCPDGQMQCESGCVDVSSDPGNCGSCGYLCFQGPAGTSPVCMAGQCNDQCTNPDLTLCNDACVNTNEDPANCGACGFTCGEGTTCGGGNCEGDICPSGYTVCGNGCADLANDPNNCGGCGNACQAGEGCYQGEC